MNWDRVKAIALKEFIHVIRDSRSLGMGIAIPLLMLILFGYALTLDVDHVPVVVWDQDKTPTSRDFLSKFSGSRYFQIQSYVESYHEAERVLDNRDAIIILAIPTDFARRISLGQSAPVQAILDGSDSNTATIALGYVEAISANYSEMIRMEQLNRRGGQHPPPPIQVDGRVWYNSDLISRNFIFPGLIAVIMMVIAAMLTSLTVAREWEKGTMEQLISTPIKGNELVIGKLIPYFAIGMFDMGIAVLMGEFLFEIPLRGGVWLLILVSALFLIGTLSMGITISIIAKSQLLASQLAMVTTFLPSFLLSGFMYPISNMPLIIQWATYLVPARYYVELLKGIYLKGVGLSVLYHDILFLFLFTVIMVTIAIHKFRKKLEM